MPPVDLLSLTTGVPEHRLRQCDAAAFTARLFGDRFPDFNRMRPVFDTAGIETRHTARPLDWYEAPRGWAERTEVYMEVAGALFLETAREALLQAGVAAADIAAVVTVSSTGIATPSLEARAITALGLSPSVQRVPVFGLGCAGGVSGLAIATRIARANPGRPVLFVCIELCTLAFRLDKLTKANIVATALFGDGAAAAVLCTRDRPAVALEEGQEYTWPDTLQIMGWDVEEEGLGVVFDRAIPPFAEEHIAPAMQVMLDRMGLRRGDVDRFVCHPGGTKVLAALESALTLEPGSLAVERAVLRDYGNMSAPTVLFILQRLLERGLPGRSMLFALGPGFTASCLPVRQAA